MAEIQKDLRIETRKSGGGSYGGDFDEAEVGVGIRGAWNILRKLREAGAVYLQEPQEAQLLEDGFPRAPGSFPIVLEASLPGLSWRGTGLSSDDTGEEGPEKDDLLPVRSQ